MQLLFLEPPAECLGGTQKRRTYGLRFLPFCKWDHQRIPSAQTSETYSKQNLRGWDYRCSRAVYQAGINSLQDKVAWINQSWVFKATSEGPLGHFIRINCRRRVGALREKRFHPATPAEMGWSLRSGNVQSEVMLSARHRWDQYAATRRRSGLCWRHSEIPLITSVTIKQRKSDLMSQSFHLFCSISRIYIDGEW